MKGYNGSYSGKELKADFVVEVMPKSTYIVVQEGVKIHETSFLTQNLSVDFDATGRVVGIELLGIVDIKLED